MRFKVLIVIFFISSPASIFSQEITHQAFRPLIDGDWRPMCIAMQADTAPHSDGKIDVEAVE